MSTINANTPALAAVLFAVAGGRFRVRLDDTTAGPGRRSGAVLDDDGRVIGDAQDYIYGGSGFAVHTVPFAGYVNTGSIDFV